MRTNCKLCDSPLNPVRHPLRRLFGTPHWKQGLQSLFSRPLTCCNACGALYAWEGDLIAESVLPSADELKLKDLRSDMANLRDSFLTVSAASALALGWMVTHPASFELGSQIITGGIGAAALLPYNYFRRKARDFRREIKKLRQRRSQKQIA